jgi:hypothetical protein
MIISFLNFTFLNKEFKSSFNKYKSFLNYYYTYLLHFLINI